MKLDDIPQEWRHILADTQQVCPGAVLAGGALRDLQAGVEIKDIDIFIPEGELIGPGVATTLIMFEIERRCLKWRDRKSRSCHFSYTGIATDVGFSVEFRDFPGSKRIPINIIFAKDKKLDISWTKRFDFTVCQILFDGKHIYETDECWLDRSHRVFRAVRNDNSEDLKRTYRRAARFKLKYPDWTFDLPPEPAPVVQLA